MAMAPILQDHAILLEDEDGISPFVKMNAQPLVPNACKVKLSLCVAAILFRAKQHADFHV